MALKATKPLQQKKFLEFLVNFYIEKPPFIIAFFYHIKGHCCKVHNLDFEKIEKGLKTLFQLVKRM